MCFVETSADVEFEPDRLAVSWMADGAPAIRHCFDQEDATAAFVGRASILQDRFSGTRIVDLYANRVDVTGDSNGHRFADMVDPATNRTRIRTVNLRSYTYSVARAYMIRLEKCDFETPNSLTTLAAQAKMSVEQFREKFQHVVDISPRYREYATDDAAGHI